MGSQNEMKKRLSRTRINDRSRIWVWIALVSIFTLTFGQGMAGADPLDFLAPWSIGSEFMYSWIWGTMSYDQGACCGFGTTNQLRDDLGLPQDNQTYRVYATIRPLEHHMLRVFGSVPELYQSQNILKKDLRLTQLPGTTLSSYASTNTVLVFPQGTLVKSEMRTSQFGFGYDLDFLTGPGHAAGMQGELRYIDLRVSLSDAQTLEVPPSNFDSTTWPGPWTQNPFPGNSLTIQQMGYQYYNTTLDELVPTLGAHAQAVLPFGFGKILPDMTLGGYTRMNFGIWPNYLNYVDIQAGLQLNTGPKCNTRRFLIAKFGVEHESILHDGQMRTGRALELKRDGLTCALEAVF
ncbi:MAG: hypothetical protein ACLQT6_16045 [Desulfomonilaceae bacterium]